MSIELNSERSRWSSLLAPAFFLFILLAFFVFPGSTIDKFNMICFGI